MEIVAFDTDDRADGQGKAGITWISKGLLNTMKPMNTTATTAGGWSQTVMRSYLKSTIKPLIPTVVRNAIVEVTKISSTYSNGIVKNGQTVTDDVWIPSVHEIFSDNSIVRDFYESTGAQYTAYSYLKRIKSHNGSITKWHLRSADKSTCFIVVTEQGSDNGSNRATTECGIALGFCTN